MSYNVLGFKAAVLRMSSLKAKNIGTEFCFLVSYYLLALPGSSAGGSDWDREEVPRRLLLGNLLDWPANFPPYTSHQFHFKVLKNMPRVASWRSSVPGDPLFLYKELFIISFKLVLTKILLPKTCLLWPMNFALQILRHKVESHWLWWLLSFPWH